MKKEPVKNWEKEFDKFYLWQEEKLNIKRFISQLLAQQKEEYKKEIKQKIDELIQNIDNPEPDEMWIKGIIHGFKIVKGLIK